MASCILYQNVDHTITLFDIPRSIEEAQGFQDKETKRLISSKAIEQPFSSIEPKSAKALKNVETASVKSLLLERFVSLALDEVHTTFKGVWCLPRVTQDDTIQTTKTLKLELLDIPEDALTHVSRTDDLSGSRTHTVIFHRNEEPIMMQLQVGPGQGIFHVPPRSSFLYGNIEATRAIFSLKAPQFNLVILDPPWPNRSARRKQSYNISNSTLGVAALLSSIPLSPHLADDALIGIWVTNKPAFHELVLGTTGFFEYRGIELVEEWVWLKVTTSGKPIFVPDSAGRKPHETLLVGRKNASGIVNEEFKRRVIIAVPDLHSRKPNLKTLFEPMLPPKYEALEVFARNLTSGWWAWGDEVLKFQGQEHWLDIPNNT